MQDFWGLSFCGITKTRLEGVKRYDRDCLNMTTGPLCEIVSKLHSTIYRIAREFDVHLLSK